jgi:lipoprotein-anchoring transpeptidase ErfK/SrfK
LILIVLSTDKYPDMENDEILDEEVQPEVAKSPENTGTGDNISTFQVPDSLSQKIWNNKIIRGLLFAIISIFISLSLFVFILYIVPALMETKSGKKTEITNNPELKKDAAYKKQINLMTRDIQRFSRKYDSYTSGQSYIVINTTNNRFALYSSKKLIREGFCSSGSYVKLQTEEDKNWVFKTPKGKFRIQGKTADPLWIKPDWAFVEEGLPIPPKNDNSRYEYGVLGDYALSIGDGFLIHGTIYKRFLGMPVTHGCVRLNDEDLKAVYNTLDIGSKVYIF